jgi:hypothetical protein
MRVEAGKQACRSSQEAGRQSGKCTVARTGGRKMQASGGRQWLAERSRRLEACNQTQAGMGGMQA